MDILCAAHAAGACHPTSRITGLCALALRNGRFHYLLLLERLRLLRYRTATWTLDAKFFATPQHRRRVLVIAVPSKYQLPEEPAPTHGPRDWLTVNDAIGNLTENDAMAEGCWGLSEDRKSRRRDTPPGGNSLDNRKAFIKVNGKRPNRSGRLGSRTNPWKPCHTLTTGAETCKCTNPIHTFLDRHLAVVEYKLLMGCPRDFIVEPREIVEDCAAMRRKYEQLANGCPRQLMGAVCRAVRESL